MINKTAVYKEVINDFDRQRTKDHNDLIKRRNTVYDLIPRIKEIDEQISNMGISAAKSMIFKPENPEEIIINIKNKISVLKTEKKNLLKENGYAEDYLNEHYRCEKCKDTGFIENERCSCLTQMLVEKAYNNSNIKEITKTENFDNFNIDYYSDEVIEDEGISPKENMQKILKDCFDFTRRFSRKKENLFFYGNSGLGKTFLCSSIAKELLDRGYTVLYMTSNEMFRKLENEKFSRNTSIFDDEVEKDAFLQDIFDVDLLIIDDLGTEFSNQFTVSELFNIINTRMLNNKPVIISTNFNMDEMQERYTERITSRIIGEYKFCKFIGDDIRFIKGIM